MPRQHVYEEDGRAYVRRMLHTRKRYQLIMLDAYDRQYIPEHLLTREFLQRGALAAGADGIVAANTFSSSRLYQNESVTYRAVFGPFYNLKSANRVILASNGRLPSIAQARRNAEHFDAAFRPLGFKAASVLSLFSTAIDWDPEGARADRSVFAGQSAQQRGPERGTESRCRRALAATAACAPRLRRRSLPRAPAASP